MAGKSLDLQSSAGLWLFVRGDGFDGVSIALLAAGRAIFIVIIIVRTRYHQRRTRGDYQV